MIRQVQPFLIAGLLLGLGACGTEPNPIRRPATIAMYDSDTAGFSAADTVHVNTVATVHFNTYGGGCVTPGAENEVKQHWPWTDIHSFQREYTPKGDEHCLEVLRTEANVVQVSFASTGRATIRVFGQTMDRTLIVLSRDIVVVP